MTTSATCFASSSAPARILSRAECEALFRRILGVGSPQTETVVLIRSIWTGNVRWGRNRPTSSGDTSAYSAMITRSRGDREIQQEVSQFDDASLAQVVRTIDQRLAAGQRPVADTTAQATPKYRASDLLSQQRYLEPTIWSDATYRMNVQDISTAVHATVEPVVAAHRVAAGYSEISAASWAVFNTNGLTAYAAATGAMYSETVRAPDGSASGWAGQSQMEWTRLNPMALSAVALKYCIDAANPVRIEPGRYTTILAPQVVARLFDEAVEVMDRTESEDGNTPYAGPTRGTTKIGTQVFDARLTITSDPTDPDCGFMPFDPEGNPYTKVTWVEQGILKALSYDRGYAQQRLHTDAALPNPHAFRVSGGSTSMEDMIRTTDRGLLVTNTNGLTPIDPKTVTVAGITRDGMWLIERGMITHPIRNFWFIESVMSLFNKVLQIGPAVRTLGFGRVGSQGIVRDLPARALNDGRVPIVAPAIKVEDFNFSRLTDAI